MGELHSASPKCSALCICTLKNFFFRARINMYKIFVSTAPNRTENRFLQSTYHPLLLIFAYRCSIPRSRSPSPPLALLCTVHHILHLLHCFKACLVCIAHLAMDWRIKAAGPLNLRHVLTLDVFVNCWMCGMFVNCGLQAFKKNYLGPNR